MFPFLLFWWFDFAGYSSWIPSLSVGSGNWSNPLKWDTGRSPCYDETTVFPNATNVCFSSLISLCHFFWSFFVLFLIFAFLGKLFSVHPVQRDGASAEDRLHREELVPSNKEEWKAPDHIIRLVRNVWGLEMKKRPCLQPLLDSLCPASLPYSLRIPAPCHGCVLQLLEPDHWYLRIWIFSTFFSFLFLLLCPHPFSFSLPFFIHGNATLSQRRSCGTQCQRQCSILSSLRSHRQTRGPSRSSSG